MVYSKRPFGGPKEVLRYLARYTHRVAISNRRLVRMRRPGRHLQVEGLQDRRARALQGDDARHSRVHPPLPDPRLPAGFHRIRHYGLLASSKRADNIARARELLTVPILPIDAIKHLSTNTNEVQTAKHPCPCCGGRMIIIETFQRGSSPKYHKYQSAPATPPITIDTS